MVTNFIEHIELKKWEDATIGDLLDAYEFEIDGDKKTVLLKRFVKI